MGIVDGCQADNSIVVERNLALHTGNILSRKNRAFYRVCDGPMKRAQSFFKDNLTSVGETVGHGDSDW